MEIWRKQILNEASEAGSVPFYMTPEEEDPAGGADFPRPQLGLDPAGEIEQMSSNTSSKQKSFLSFNPDPSDYKIEGPTHGKISHMIKHMWEIPGLYLQFVGTMELFQAEVRKYIKDLEDGRDRDEIYFHDFKYKNKIKPENGDPISISQILSALKGSKDATGDALFGSSIKYRHPEATKATTLPTLGNTLDYIQDKYHLGRPLHSIERRWLATYAQSLTAIYNDAVSKHMSTAKDISTLPDEEIKAHWDAGAPIKFKNIFGGEPKTNFLNKRGLFVAQNADGKVATMFIIASKLKGPKGVAAPDELFLPQICGYLARSPHAEAKRLLCIIECAECEGAEEPQPQEAPAPDPVQVPGTDKSR